MVIAPFDLPGTSAPGTGNRRIPISGSRVLSHHKKGLNLPLGSAPAVAPNTQQERTGQRHLKYGPRGGVRDVTDWSRHSLKRTVPAPKPSRPQNVSAESPVE